MASGDQTNAFGSAKSYGKRFFGTPGGRIAQRPGDLRPAGLRL